MMLKVDRAPVHGDAASERRRASRNGTLQQHGTRSRRSAPTCALVWCFIALACGAPEPTMIGTPIDPSTLSASPSAPAGPASSAPSAKGIGESDGQLGPAPLLHAQGEPLWTLDRQQSYLSLISIKQTDVAEVHTFETFSARVGADGAASLVIDLASIATNVELRDERLRDVLFETVAFPTASASLRLDLTQIDAVPPGGSVELPVAASFNLHGREKILETTLLVVRLSDASLAVKTKTPIVLDARDYGLEPGIQRLLELAGLESISKAVPVEFMLTFQRETGASAGNVGG